MGKAKRKQINNQAFLALPENGRCIYCGKKSETVDHFPPRIFFRGKHWPETYYFPACEACNSKKSHDEQALAYIVKEQDLKLQDDEDYQKILKGVRNNEPWIIDEVKQLVGDEAKQGGRDLFGDLGSAVIFPAGEYGIFRFGEKGQHLLKILPHWLGRALYFLHTKDICPGDVYSMILKPVDLQKKDIVDFFGLHELVPEICRGKMNLSDQFDYRYQILDGTFSAIIRFGSAQFHFFVVTSSNESSISLYKRLAQSKSPFFNSTKELAASVTAD